MSIAIVDYGMGNTGSILNMCKYLGMQAVISSDPAEVARANKVILPGVGAFDQAVHHLKERGLFEAIDQMVRIHKVPVLGICLGMQLMARGSEEGNLPGFGWIDADVKKFSFNGEVRPRIPHTGWNSVTVINHSVLTEKVNGSSKFYFVHSYYVTCDSEKDSIARTTYGFTFDSIIGRNNIFGCQFHPEKSHRYGMQLLENFSKA